MIKLLKDKIILTSSLFTIWENTDGCTEQYICASAPYLISVMSQCYEVTIDRVISAPVHGLVPAQDVLFALILWYGAKSVFRS